MTFYYVPLEELDERYTIQMKRWIIDELELRGIDYEVIEGKPLKSETQGHQFLDWSSRVHYSISQVSQISRLFSNEEIKDGDIFFVPDIWHFGIESIGYMSQMSGIDVKMYAIQHAGVFDKTDLVHNLYKWGSFLEMAWYNLFNAVFVGSDYLGDKIQNYTGATNIITTGQVWKPDDIEVEEFEDGDDRPIVLWPHRIGPDKNIHSFYTLINTIKKEHSNLDIRYIITSGRLNQGYEPHLGAEFMRLTKPQYYGLMQKASLMLSTAYHENFGYTVHEATALGTPVLCPNRACYSEMILSEQNRYDTDKEMLDKVVLHLTDTVKLPIARLKNTRGFEEMLDYMLGE